MALSAARNTRRMLSPYDMEHEFVVATGVTIYEGGMAGVNAAGLLVPANTSTMVRMVGRACSTILAAAAGSRLKVEQGIFSYGNGASIAAADRFDPVYVVDDESVNKTNTAPQAGLFYEVDPLGGVYVFMGPFVQIVPTA